MLEALIPKLTGQYSLKDFGRGNPAWRAALAKLKGAAEQAKIEVCNKKAPASVWVEDLCKDDTGKVIDFEYSLKPEELEQIVSPYVTHSINLCKKAMEEKGLSGANIEKILMVGGTSLIPWLRDRVKNELGIALESSIDPMTVVARGAAIFAGTQQIDRNKIPPDKIPVGVFELRAVYQRIGSDLEPPVSGKVIHSAKGSMKGYTIELVEAKSQWRSGKIPLGDDGGFDTQLHAVRGRENEFHVELCDSKGTVQKIMPDRLPYTPGIDIGRPQITHNLGVALANNEPYIFFEKGTALPARGSKVFHAARAFRKGQKGEFLEIPVIEGEDRRRADRNDTVGSLKISAENLKRDVVTGSDVEVTLHMDESRMLTVKAYIPVVDEEFEAVIKYDKEKQSVSELQDALEKEKKRLQELRDKAVQINSLKARQALARIDSEDMLGNIQSLLEAAKGDLGAIPEFQNKLVALRIAIDAVGDALEWPTLVNEARSFMEEAKRVIRQYGNQDEKNTLNILEQDIQKAIDSGDPDMLRKYLDEIKSIYWGALQRQDGFWVGQFEYLEKKKQSMQDIQQAQHLIAQGHKAINNGDIEGLKAVARQLIGMLPVDERPPGSSGITL